MSYRAFKHLLGETSLERKCRFLLGGGILVLITASFWWFAFQTEHLAYNQTLNTGRLLINPLVARQHVKIIDKEHAGTVGWGQWLDEFQQNVEKNWPEGLGQYASRRFIVPAARSSDHEPTDRFERQLLAEFLEDRNKFEASRIVEESRC